MDGNGSFNKIKSRREVLKEGLALAIATATGTSKAVAGDKAIQAAERPADLWRSIRDLETKLAPGGSFDKKLSNPHTSQDEVDWILRYVRAVVERMDLVKILPDSPDLDPRAVRRAPAPLAHLHGQQQIKLTAKEKNREGKVVETHRLCVGSYVTFGGSDNFFVTNNHCVTGTKEDANKEFKKLGVHGEDLAVRYEPNYKGPALQLDPNLTDHDMQGRMMMMRSLDRHGNDVDRISFLIKMNRSLYEKIFKRKPERDGYIGKQVAENFAFIMGPEDSKLDARGNIPPQGQSGTPIFVWMGTSETGGYKPGGTFFGARALGRYCVGREENGECSSLGYAVGIDALKALCESAKDQRETESRPEGAGFVSRVIRN